MFGSSKETQVLPAIHVSEIIEHNVKHTMFFGWSLMISSHISINSQPPNINNRQSLIPEYYNNSISPKP